LERTVEELKKRLEDREAMPPPLSIHREIIPPPSIGKKR
jgi:hypothetical protein